MFSDLGQLVENQSGATAIEYGLIAGGIALTIIPVIGDMNSGVMQMFSIVAGLFSSF